MTLITKECTVQQAKKWCSQEGYTKLKMQSALTA